MNLVQLEKQFFFLAPPRLFIDRWVQVIIPAFPALLSRPLGDVVSLLELLGDLSPVVEAELGYKLSDGFIFLGEERSTS